MAQLIDTSIFVAMDRRGESLDGFVALMGDEPFAIASITASELLVGVYGTLPASRQERRLKFVEVVLDRYRCCRSTWLPLAGMPDSLQSFLLLAG